MTSDSPEATEDASILAQLRSHTRDLHAAAEQAVNLDARLVSTSTYGQFLTVLYGFYSAAEQRLARIPGWSAVGLDLNARQKAFLLLRDLQEIDQLPCPTRAAELCPLPELADISVGMGWLYVVEGSTLGGQFIDRAVGHRLGLTPDRGRSFFSGYGDQTRPMWHQFCERLTAYHRGHPEAANRIVTGAKDLFLRFKGWLECRLT